MILTIANKKGGVGKTTVSQNLAAGLHREGYKILCIDLDEQANLTQSFGFVAPQETNVFHGLQAAANESKFDIREIVRRSDTRPDLIVSGNEMNRAAVQFSTTDFRERLLESLLGDLPSKYDVVIIDAPPAFGLAVKNALYISDLVIVPALAEFLPVMGIELFKNDIERFANRMRIDVRFGGIIFNQHNPRRILSSVLEEDIKARYPGQIFDSSIRQNIALSEAQSRGQNIFEYDDEMQTVSNGQKDFVALTQEFIKLVS